MTGLPPPTRANGTVMQDIHPDDHNQFSLAISALQGTVDGLQSTVEAQAGQISSLQSDVATLQATAVSLQNQINAIGSSGSNATAVAAALASHVATTTSVHGIANTAQLIRSSDASVGDVNEVDALPGSPTPSTLYLIPLNA